MFYGKASEINAFPRTRDCEIVAASLLAPAGSLRSLLRSGLWGGFIFDSKFAVADRGISERHFFARLFVRGKRAKANANYLRILSR